MTVGDHAWLESARRRMIAGEAPHLELFFLNHLYGKPKDVDRPVDRPSIVFVSQYGQPGDYDPLAGIPAKVAPSVVPARSQVAESSSGIELDPDDPDALVVMR